MADPVEAFVKNSPGLMLRLTELYAENKDLNERAKVKRRMSAVLAFLATDTKYPQLPQDRPDEVQFGQANYGLVAARAQPQRGAAFVQQMDGDGDLDETLGGIAPIPGAERIV